MNLLKTESGVLLNQDHISEIYLTTVTCGSDATALEAVMTNGKKYYMAILKNRNLALDSLDHIFRVRGDLDIKLMAHNIKELDYLEGGKDDVG